MTEDKARKVLSEINEIAKRHGLWISHTEERKPDLRMIRINEISIKIDGDKK